MGNIFSNCFKCVDRDPNSIEASNSDSEDAVNTQFVCENGRPSALQLDIVHCETKYRKKVEGFRLAFNNCIVCQKTFLVQKQAEDHMREVHSDPFKILPDMINKHSISKFFEIVHNRTSATRVFLTLRYIHPKPCIIRHILFVCSHQYVNVEKAAKQVTLNDILDFTLPRDLFSHHNDCRSVLLVFERTLEYVEHFYLTAVTNEAIKTLPSVTKISKPTNLDTSSKRKPKQAIEIPSAVPTISTPTNLDTCLNRMPKNEIEIPPWVQKNPKLTNLNTTFSNRNPNKLNRGLLLKYSPSKELVSLFNNFFQIKGRQANESEVAVYRTVRNFIKKDSPLNAKNYVEYFCYAMQIDDCGLERELMAFDRVQRLEAAGNGCYRLNFDELGELPPDICDGTYMSLRKVNPDGSYAEKIEEQSIMTVQKVEPDHLLLHPGFGIRNFQDFERFNDINEKVQKKSQFDVNVLYNIRFKNNRIPIRMEHHALNIINKQQLTQFLFPKAAPPQKKLMVKEFKWFDSNIDQNPEQIQAIKSIVNATSFPLPYIIFGPPGTGKTTIIVEAICQLWKAFPSSRILVTAQSNSACDEIMKRLLQFMPADTLYRMFTQSFEKKQYRIDNELMAISSFKTGKFEYPSYEELYNYVVVACTLTTAGRLALAAINPDHFTHVFIDECASSTEVATLIPIAGIITKTGEITGNIILAGDTKQLGPVLKTGFVTQLNYDKSLQERLMEQPIYQKNAETNQYNPNLITKLVQSFRSHPKIIEFSNKAFYDDELQDMAQADATKWALNWHWLPNRKFPIIFEPSYGASCKDEKTMSTYNEHQIKLVLKYVAKILSVKFNLRTIEQEDVGIISPYRKQCHKLAIQCRIRNWPNIEVGTVETFQGREKPVIIVSTVKSGTKNVGFLSNPKRLNVTVTRAKALMIVIGNPETLKTDPYWYDFIKYCVDNGGCTQKDLNLGNRPPETNVILTDSAQFNYHERLTDKDQRVFVEDFF